MNVFSSNRLTRIWNAGFQALFTTSETVDIPMDLYVISFPNKTHERLFGSSWFGGSSRHASMHVQFSVRAMRSETSIKEGLAIPQLLRFYRKGIKGKVLGKMGQARVNS